MAVAGGVEMGVGERVWRDPKHRAAFLEFGDGQRDAVDAERAFVDAQPVDFRWQGDFETMILPMRFERENLAGGIDVTLNEMSAESRGGEHRSFEINGGTRPQITQRGDAEGLGQDVETGAVRSEFRHGKAAAIDCDRIAESEFALKRKIKREAGLVAAGLERDDGADGFNEAGEHNQKGKVFSFQSELL